MSALVEPPRKAMSTNGALAYLAAMLAGIGLIYGIIRAENEPPSTSVPPGPVDSRPLVERP